MRLSIDVVSIKNNRFYGRVFVECSKINAFETRVFRTTPSLEVVRVHSEDLEFENGFSSFEKAMDGEELQKALDDQVILSLYHTQQNKDQQVMGRVNIDLEKMKNLKFKKTNFSYVRVYDKYHIIYDAEREGEFKIGELRVRIFLEDLGPIQNQPQNREEEIVKQIKNEEEMTGEPNQQINDHFEFDVEEIQMKALWELENWKKNEEQKFYLEMKKQEYEMMSKLQLKIQEQEKEFQKTLINQESRVKQYEQSLKNKAAILNKREQEINSLVSEQKSKLRQIVEREMMVDQGNKLIDEKYQEQIKDLKQRIKNQNLKEQKLNTQIEEREQKIKDLQKQIEESPMSQLQKNNEQLENKVNELNNKIEQFVLLKQEYESIFNGLQNKIKQMQNQEQNEKVPVQQKSIDEFKKLREDLKELKFDNDIMDSQELSKLIQEKDFLISMGIDQQDIILQEIEEEIRKLKKQLAQFFNSQNQ